MFPSFVLTVGLAALACVSAAPEKRALAHVYSSCTVPNTVALTFDDGPYEYIREISDKLSAAGAKGTFFLNGDNWSCIYDSASASGIKYAYSKGHQLASHTWSHAHLNSLSWDQIHDEMWRVEQALAKIVGVTPAFMRPPYGEYNDLVRQASAVRGQSLVIWDFDSEDSLGASVATSESLYTKAISKHPKTLLALNHEVYKTTAEQVLPFAISKLQKAGYKLVTLAECVGKNPYQKVVKAGTRDSSWKC